jgi:centrosomal protein CEP350
MALLGFSKRPRREKLIIRWSRKRRDHVDELLVREAQEEEQAWTNYELDEAAVKSQISDAMLNMLISDTASAVSKAIESKTSKLGQKQNES